MAFDYINEAFKRLEILDEEMFNTSTDGVRQLGDFMNNDFETEVVRVIDADATSEEDLQSSYVGKVIVNCNVCHSHIFENKEDIMIDEDGFVNVDKTCPYCGEQEGFVIVGEIAPYNKEEENSDEATQDQDAVVDTEPVETVDAVDESINEAGCSRATARANNSERAEQLEEDFKEVSITTEDQHLEMTSDENGKVTVTTEPIESALATEEVISPVSDETTDEIIANAEVAEEAPLFDEEEDLEFDFEDVDEEGLDELGEAYLRNVYENVSSFKTTNAYSTDTKLIIEGIINFSTGASKKTGFVFEAKDANSRGQVRFTGSNKQLTEAVNAFSLVGRVTDKKLCVESLKYNYTVNNAPIRGVVRRK